MNKLDEVFRAIAKRHRKSGRYINRDVAQRDPRMGPAPTGPVCIWGRPMPRAGIYGAAERQHSSSAVRRAKDLVIRGSK